MKEKKRDEKQKMRQERCEKTEKGKDNTVREKVRYRAITEINLPRSVFCLLGRPLNSYLIQSSESQLV